MRALLVWCLGLAVLGASCAGKTDQREYTLQGQVTAVTPTHDQATVNHEEIKGFMTAMTMPYKVQDPKQLEGIVPGDLINAKLIVLPSDAYLTDVRKVGQAPLPAAPADTAAPTASSGFELLKPGEAVPDASFVDQSGKKRRFSSFKGSPVLMTFIYTKCPMPTFCPLMDQHFATIQKKLKDDPALKGRVHLVSVSFDPIVDTPPVLKAHAQTLGADLNTWTFLTGDRDDVDQFAARFGVSVARSQTDQRDITHNLRTALVDGGGKLVKVYIGNEWTPDQAIADVKPVVGAN
ncbi:MAG: SCO family protein [Acidobacteriota bacterium]